jgi:signal transduction histidine kinase
MNYEIRTPLNSIVGFAEFFQLPHEIKDEPIFISEIRNNSDSLLKLINNILFLSRIDARMIEIKPAPTDFAMIFESMCITYWDSFRDIQNSNTRLLVQNHYQRMVLEIDSQNVGHIIEQLIANAVQFTKGGTVCTSYEYTGDHLIVSVEDTGSGIDEQLLGHIFERFSTGANNGTGLGLSICHELVRLMNGTINIKSTEGKGTTVWFTIPCKAIEIERISNA